MESNEALGPRYIRFLGAHAVMPKAYGAAQLRDELTGHGDDSEATATPRNLLGRCSCAWLHGSQILVGMLLNPRDTQRNAAFHWMCVGYTDNRGTIPGYAEISRVAPDRGGAYAQAIERIEDSEDHLVRPGNRRKTSVHLLLGDAVVAQRTRRSHAILAIPKENRHA